MLNMLKIKENIATRIYFSKINNCYVINCDVTFSDVTFTIIVLLSNVTADSKH